jgi:adenosylcobinamide-GDP ribazoletransferase
LVGGGVGLGVAGVYAGARLGLPALVAASVAVAAGVVLTGAFHEDGLADAADAAGGWTVDQRREIIDDPRHGTFGVVALVLSVVVRVAALAALSPRDAVGALAAAHALSRAGAVTLMALGPVPVAGLGASYARHLRRRHVAVAVVTGTGVAVAGLGVAAVGAVAIVAVVTLCVRRWARRALDGITGDVLGTAEQLSEGALLVLAAGL